MRISGYNSDLVPLLLFLCVIVGTSLLLYTVAEVVTYTDSVIEGLLG